MDLRDLIEKKKHGQELSKADIRHWIAGRVHNKFPDYQTTALLMAIVLKGMGHRETVDLTREMARYGEPLSRPVGTKRIGNRDALRVGDTMVAR